MTRLTVLNAPTAPRSNRVALISLTTFCNARCAFCCVLDVLNRPELNPTDEQIRAKMVEARAEGCTILGFTGGEPTVHPRFAEFCRYGRELGYESITINTNGIQFKSRRWTEEVLAAGLTHLDFSIHGDSAELHDAMMAREGAFDAFVRGIGHVTDLASRHPVSLGSTTVVSSRNAARLPAIADKLVDLGVTSLRFKHCFEGAEGTDAGLVGRYDALMGYVREAARRVRARGATVSVTHFPLCLLGDEAVFATDLTDEDVLSINRDGAVLLDGRASMHRRQGASVCDQCELSSSCTLLDRRYVAAHGESELRPVRDMTALRDLFDRGLARHPGEPMRSRVRRFIARRDAAGAPRRAPDATETPTMSAGFISPTFRVLEVNWEHDYEMVKLGVPTLMGHLYRLGHRDLSHWDFDAQICDACAEDPTAFDLRQYFDQALVTGFLQGTDDALRAQTEKILDALGVTERAIYGLSLSAVLDRIVNVRALAAVSQCMARVLRERYPGCTIILGGLQASPDSLHRGLYTEFMEQCPAIDYAFIGHVEAETVQLFRNVWRGEHALNARLSSRILLRAADGSVVAGDGSRGPLDADLLSMAGLRKGVAAHTNIGASAQAAEADACGDAKPAAVLPAASLVRHVPAPAGSRGADYELTELDAAEAGAQPYDSIPAAVPVFDKRLVDSFRYTGLQIMKRFHFDKERMLRYSRFEGERVVVLPHIFVRGCNAPCGFCSYAYSKIEGEDVAETIAGLRFLSETYDCKHFHFLNTQINSVYKYCEMFCDGLIESGLDLLWSDCCNMRALDEKLLEKLRRAGAMRLVFGVESPEDSMLQMIHKGITTARIERLLKASHDVGIWNHVLLIAGMPHETKPKQDRIMEFLERTAPTVDFYSVSSYYLIATSPWGKDPAKYGIERISSPSQLLEEQAFNEVPGGRWESEGLRWPEKKRQIVESTQRTYKTISRAKGQSRCVAGNIDLYLLMFLYRILGHDQKAEIVRTYTETAREIFPTAGKAQRELHELPRNRFRVHVPYVVGRVNEGDQSAMVQVPVDIDVTAHADAKPGFCATPRYSLAWRSPAVGGDDGPFTRRDLVDLREQLPTLVAPLLRMIGPFAQALDARMAPTTPERMAQLVALNLPRYKPFANEGYTVVGPATQRSIMERNLEWSGLS